MIRLQLLLIRRLVLGTDQGLWGPASIKREVQVALVGADFPFEMLSAFLLHGEPVHRLLWIMEESDQLGAVRALASDLGRAMEVGWFLGGFRRERFELLPAR